MNYIYGEINHSKSKSKHMSWNKYYITFYHLSGGTTFQGNAHQSSGFWKPIFTTLKLIIQDLVVEFERSQTAEGKPAQKIN